MNTQTPNSKRQGQQLLTLACALALAQVILPSRAAAQAAATVSAETLARYDKNANGFLDPDEIDKMNADIKAGGDVVTMSPFEVSSSRDKGFQTGSVGTTARMKVELADTPVSYSIINREFIDALGITNMGEAASWATNQTFLSTDNGGMSNNSSQQYYQRGQVVNTGQGNSTGGQRNSFQNANMINDSYDVETFDFGRGPNAALFGNGSGGGGLGGISSTQTKRVQFERSRTTIGQVVGSWGIRRTTLDYNTPLTERLGVRVNLVADDSPAWRYMDRSRTKGITTALTWKPTSTTTLTLDASHQMKQTHNVGSGFDEYMSGWDGNTVFRGPVTNAMLSTNAALGATTSGGSLVLGVNPVIGTTGITFNGEPNGITRMGNNFYVGDMYTMTATNYRNYPVTRRSDTTSRVPLWSKTAPNGAYFQRASMPVQGNGQTQPSYGVNRMAMYPGNREGLPEDMMDRLESSSRWKHPSARFEGSFDTPTSWQWSKDIQLTLTQRVGSHVYFDVSADVSRNHQGGQTFDQPNSAGEGGRSVTLDIDQLTPDGKPNPHFLEPYSTMGIGGRDDYTGDEGLRTNIAYTDLNLGKWGAYNFNLQAGASQRKSSLRGYVLAAKFNADPRRWAGDEIRYRVNWSDVNHSYTVPTSLSFTDVNWTDPNNPVIQAPVTITPTRIIGTSSGFGGGNWNDSYDQQRTLLFTGQGKYFSNKLVLTLAMSRSMTKAIRKSNVALGDLPSTTLAANALTPAMISIYPGYVPHDWNAQDAIMRPDAPADYFSMTYLNKNTTTGAIISTKPVLSGNRPRITQANGLSVPNPVYLNDRFRDDYNNPTAKRGSTSKELGIVWNPTRWLSPYLNYSTSFTPPSASAQDINFNQLEATNAYGYDMGTNLNLFNGRLTMRLNYFKNTREHNATNAPTNGPINTLYQANRFDDPDATNSGRNAFGIQDQPGNGDYQDSRSDGREIEIGGSPIRGLRLTLNGGWGFTTNSARFPLSKEYIPAHEADFEKILIDAGGMLDLTQKPNGSTRAPGKAVNNPSATGFLLDQKAAVDAYNNIWTNYESIFNDRNARTKTQPTINFFSDYTLQSGALRGLRMGAGVRWQGSIRFATGGSVTILDAAGTSAIDDPAVDGNTIYFLKGSYQSTATLAYTFRLKNGNSLGLNLVVNNPLNDRGYVWGDGSLGTNFGTLRQPEGNLLKPNRVNRADLISRFKEPTNFRLTATYSFDGNGRR